GSWTGTGLRSSTAAASTGSLVSAIGVVEASAIGVHAFGGRDVDSDALLVAYTLAGDANLDGTIDSLDFGRLATNFGRFQAGWQGGDFNYDGRSNALDFNVLASAFGAVMPASSLAGQFTLAPEPGSSAAMLA